VVIPVRPHTTDRQPAWDRGAADSPPGAASYNAWLTNRKAMGRLLAYNGQDTNSNLKPGREAGGKEEGLARSKSAKTADTQALQPRTASVEDADPVRPGTPAQGHNLRNSTSPIPR